MCELLSTLTKPLKTVETFRAATQYVLCVGNHGGGGSHTNVMKLHQIFPICKIQSIYADK